MREFIKIEKDRISFIDARYYEHASGEFYPSCTTILSAYPKSAQFFEWLKQVGGDADEIRDEAGRKGSVVHQLCEDYDDGLECHILGGNGQAQYKQIEWSQLEKYVEFRTRFPYELIANERHYISPKLGFAGTLDRVFRVDGKLILLDIKTGNAIHNHFWLQLAAYKALWDEFNKEKIKGVRILWLNAKTRTQGKSGDTQGTGWQLKEPESKHAHYWKLFKSVFSTWTEENGDMKPRNTSYNLVHKLNLTNGTEALESHVNSLSEGNHV